MLGPAVTPGVVLAAVALTAERASPWRLVVPALLLGGGGWVWVQEERAASEREAVAREHREPLAELIAGRILGSGGGR